MPDPILDFFDKNIVKPLQTVVDSVIVKPVGDLANDISAFIENQRKLAEQRAIEQRIENEKRKEQREYEAVCHFTDNLPFEEFRNIVYAVTKPIKRIHDVEINSSRITINVDSQSHISQWSFCLDFNDRGELTGNYRVVKWGNTDSIIQRSIGDKIRAEIMRKNGPS